MSAEHDDWAITATYHVDRIGEAAALVDRALVAINSARTGSGVTKADAQWQARAERVGRAFAVGGSKDAVVAAVAQWLSAMASAKPAQGAREAADHIVKLADEVATLQRRLADAALALRYEQTTDLGREIAGCAYVAEASLREALPALRIAGEAAKELKQLAPADARGRGGLVGSLRGATPDDALALALVSLWTAYGLSDAGGRGGDGLDIFLAEILGEKTARKALTKARTLASTKICAP